jgi:hypothetical protein
VRKWMSLCMAERSGATIPYGVTAMGHARTVAAGSDTDADTRGRRSVRLIAVDKRLPGQCLPYRLSGRLR